MILPTTYGTALLLTILSMICWGSWANTFKMSRKWRFELFYFDYAFGVLLAAAIAMFTFGAFGELPTAYENLRYFAGKRNIFYGFLGGVVFNLANMLLVAAIALSGMAVAFPVGIGLALVIGVILNYIVNPQGNPALLFGGTVLVVAAIVVDALAYRLNEGARRLAAAAAATSTQAPAKSRSSRQRTANTGLSRTAKGLVIALIAGVLMGVFYPLVQLATTGDIGLRPYSVMLVFAAGVFFSTFIFNLYFMNLPVEGQPVSFGQYFKGSARNHLLGILGGAVWAVGALSNFCAAAAPKEVNVGPAISYALGQGATMISALWGLLVWKEFQGSSGRVKTLLAAMLVLFVVGLALVSIAPLH